MKRHNYTILKQYTFWCVNKIECGVVTFSVTIYNVDAKQTTADIMLCNGQPSTVEAKRPKPETPGFR